MNYNCAGIIVAAGSGTRMGGVSKPNIKILGVTLFEYVLKAFFQSMADDIVVVCSKDNIESLKEIAAGYNKEISFVLGGSTRAESVFNGITAAKADIACVHDCARPFITACLIDQTIKTAAEKGASCLCSPITDTVKHKDPQTGIVSTPNRDNMFAVQTPQCFKTEHYLNAKAKAGESYRSFTDETSLLEAAGVEVEYIKTSCTNIKLTTVDDIPIAEILMKRALNND